ncbi:MAG TPA: manganese efflux pump MntP family protein [Thermoanaerobaculia bacterium]|nr:manganese efflux pump MntP family protein [Thermoanaerobaculia bacterium]
MNDLPQLLLLACAVAVDTIAVASSASLTFRDFRRLDAFRMAAAFGLSQGSMAFIGWLGGVSVLEYVEAWDHWVVFLVLSVIGGRMVWEALRGGEETAPRRLTTTVLAALAFATSIDALAVGVTLGLRDSNAWLACLLIAAVTFSGSFVAGIAGRHLGERFGKRLEVGGGLILIAIGSQILYSHLRE